MKYQIGDKVKLKLKPNHPRYNLFDLYFKAVIFEIVEIIHGIYICQVKFDIQNIPFVEKFACLENELVRS